MIAVERLTEVERLRPTEEQLNGLRDFLTQEIEDALSARMPQEVSWRESLRLYEGVPRQSIRNIPIENAPNIEITLAAASCDSIYAQAIDLIYATSPVITTRATSEEFVPHAKALQRFVNWGVANEYGLRAESEHAILDDVQLGSGFYYIPWVEEIKKTKVSKVTSRGPRIYAIAPEDVLVPGGARADIQRTHWIAIRLWLSENEFALRADAGKWNGGAMPVGNVGWVRSRRETLGRTTTNKTTSILYEIYDVYANYDIDGDGLAEDLLITWDRTSRTILKLRYNPCDRRPIEAMRYQIRGHLFYGIGVIDMLRGFQEGATEVYNYWLANALLANCRLWKSKRGMVETPFRIWPNKLIELDDPNSLEGEQLADTYQSMPQALAVTISMAERRAGVNELSMPRPSQVLGSRTPGITALSLLQQVNRRFTTAFDGIRLGTSAAVRQCLYRYQEKLLANDTDAEATIRKVLGTKDAGLVIALLKRDDFDEAVSVELTASSASINKEADRQGSIVLANLLGQYYQRILELVAIASRPDVPEPVREVAKKIAEKAGEVIDRTIRTFDQIRDPETFIVRVEEELDTGLEGLTQGGILGQLLGLVGGTPPGGNGGGGEGADVGAGA
jgi:hypothetical protein